MSGQFGQPKGSVASINIQVHLSSALRVGSPFCALVPVVSPMAGKACLMFVPIHLANTFSLLAKW